MQDLIMIDLRMVFHYCVQKPALIPKVLSQNFTDKSCLFKVKNMQSGSSSVGSMRRGEGDSLTYIIL